VKFHRPPGKIQRRGYLFVSQALHHAAKHFLLATRELYRTADGMSSLQQFFRLLG